jgi:glycosyltransferase involved in cell wall biosynthesis
MRPLFNKILDFKIAPSELAARYTFGNKEFNKGKVQLLNNGIDLNVYKYNLDQRNIIRKQFCINDMFVIGHIGRFSRQKNHIFLIEIFREIVKKRNDAVLLLVGNGELEDSVRILIEQYNISSKVIFTGVRSDIPALLSAMDVFVFPSLYEGMPNTVIEAQSVGLPCVISDSITEEARITDLITYVSLKKNAAEWADVILTQQKKNRDKARRDIVLAGYDIGEVTKKFQKIVFESEE